MVAGNKYKRSHKHIKMERLQIAFFIRVCKFQNGIEVMFKHWIVRVVTVSPNMTCHSICGIWFFSHSGHK